MDWQGRPNWSNWSMSIRDGSSNSRRCCILVINWQCGNVCWGWICQVEARNISCEQGIGVVFIWLGKLLVLLVRLLECSLEQCFLGKPVFYPSKRLRYVSTVILILLDFLRLPTSRNTDAITVVFVLTWKGSYPISFCHSLQTPPLCPNSSKDTNHFPEII